MLQLDENNSITHDVTGKYTGASVLLKKSPEGTGIIAGGPARSVLRDRWYPEYPYKVFRIKQQAERSTCYYRGS